MRLIDADALLDAISVHLERIEQEFKDVQSVVEFDGPIEEVEVRGEKYEKPKCGKWEICGVEPDAYDITGIKTWAAMYMCSNCGQVVQIIENDGIYNYCPCCGAKMDGGTDNETD